METIIPGGVWPTMVTPFATENELSPKSVQKEPEYRDGNSYTQVDFKALGEIVEWYIENGADGLFAVCQSSEMFYLSLEERVKIAKYVKDKTKNRVPVVASGHISETIDEQIEELTQISKTGVDAVVLVSNRLAKQDESDSVWIQNADKLLTALPDVTFGIYECPYPYKRLMSEETLKWSAKTGRIVFLKDTCCDIEQLALRLEYVRNSNLKIYNANSATLLESLKLGAAGFSGVMSNFHPKLYSWLISNWKEKQETASIIQDFLGVASCIERYQYPTNAKYNLKQQGINISLDSRSKNKSDFTAANRLQVDQLRRISNEFFERWSL